MFNILDDNESNDDHDDIFSIGNYDVLQLNTSTNQRGQIDSEIIQRSNNVYYGIDI